MRQRLQQGTRGRHAARRLHRSCNSTVRTERPSLPRGSELRSLSVDALRVTARSVVTSPHTSSLLAPLFLQIRRSTPPPAFTTAAIVLGSDEDDENFAPAGDDGEGEGAACGHATDAQAGKVTAQDVLNWIAGRLSDKVRRRCGCHWARVAACSIAFSPPPLSRSVVARPLLRRRREHARARDKSRFVHVLLRGGHANERDWRRSQL